MRERGTSLFAHLPSGDEWLHLYFQPQPTETALSVPIKLLSVRLFWDAQCQDSQAKLTSSGEEYQGEVTKNQFDCNVDDDKSIRTKINHRQTNRAHAETPDKCVEFIRSQASKSKTYSSCRFIGTMDSIIFFIVVRHVGAIGRVNKVFRLRVTSGHWSSLQGSSVGRDRGRLIYR